MKAREQEKELINERVAAGELRLVSEMEASLAELLNRPIDTTMSVTAVTLLRNRAIRKHFQVGEIDIYSICLPNYLVWNNDLIALLNLGRPRLPGAPVNPSYTAGIIADWEIPDKPDQGGNRELIEMHAKGLKEHWDRFINGDRSIYMRAITIADPKKIRSLLHYGIGDLIPGEKARQVQAEALSTIDNDAYLVSAAKYSQGYASSVSFKELPERIKEEHLEAAKRDAIRGRVVVEADACSIVSTRVFDGVERVIVNHGQGIVEAKIGRSRIKFDINGDRPSEIESLIDDQAADRLTPWVVWAKDRRSGQRYYLDIVPEKLREGIDPRANPRLGLVMAVGLSEKDRDNLPKRLGLPKSRVDQDMAEAQLPVLVYMFEGLLLRSQFFSNAERGFQLAESSLTRSEILKERFGFIAGKARLLLSPGVLTLGCILTASMIGYEMWTDNNEFKDEVEKEVAKNESAYSNIVDSFADMNRRPENSSLSSEQWQQLQTDIQTVMNLINPDMIKSESESRVRVRMNYQNSLIPNRFTLQWMAFGSILVTSVIRTGQFIKNIMVRNNRYRNNVGNADF